MKAIHLAAALAAGTLFFAGCGGSTSTDTPTETKIDMENLDGDYTVDYASVDQAVTSSYSIKYCRKDNKAYRINEGGDDEGTWEVRNGNVVVTVTSNYTYETTIFEVDKEYTVNGQKEKVTKITDTPCL